MKAHKLEVYIIDFEDYGSTEYVTIIEQHRHLSGNCGSVQTIDIGEWSDDHPLNRRTTDKAKYFAAALSEQKVE